MAADRHVVDVLRPRGEVRPDPFQPFLRGLLEAGRQYPPFNLVPGFFELAPSLALRFARHSLARGAHRLVNDAAREPEPKPVSALLASAVDHRVSPSFGGLPPSFPFSRAMARMRSIPSRSSRTR